ncbi:hypothetical protein [Serratia nevei]|uniref:hypothetical protein n=1 Tax=Serratia nevei TaxID=2703794 RepID=UPI003FA7C50D
MDNKLSELSKPEQFDAAVEIHGGEPFAVWAPAVNGSHVKAEQYFALLAELAEKDKRIAELERANQSQDDHINQQQDRIESLEKKNGDLGRSLGAAEKQPAPPVRLPDDLEANTEPCVICGKISSHPEGWHYCNRKNAEGDA